jgi:hypothetical protein
MNITTITVGWSETCSLPEYCNVKPSLTLTAQIGEDEDAQATTNALLAEVKKVVHEQVDEALETVGCAPKYYEGPRYRVVYDGLGALMLVIPTEVNVERRSCREMIAATFSLAGAERYAKRRLPPEGVMLTVDDPAQAAMLVGQPVGEGARDMDIDDVDEVDDDADDDAEF